MTSFSIKFVYGYERPWNFSEISKIEFCTFWVIFKTRLGLGDKIIKT